MLSRKCLEKRAESAFDGQVYPFLGIRHVSPSPGDDLRVSFAGCNDVPIPERILVALMPYAIAERENRHKPQPRLACHLFCRIADGRRQLDQAPLLIVGANECVAERAEHSRVAHPSLRHLAPHARRLEQESFAGLALRAIGARTQDKRVANALRLGVRLLKAHPAQHLASLDIRPLHEAPHVADSLHAKRRCAYLERQRRRSRTLPAPQRRYVKADLPIGFAPVAATRRTRNAHPINATSPFFQRPFDRHAETGQERSQAQRPALAVARPFETSFAERLPVGMPRTAELRRMALRRFRIRDRLRGCASSRA